MSGAIDDRLLGCCRSLEGMNAAVVTQELNAPAANIFIIVVQQGLKSICAEAIRHV